MANFQFDPNANLSAPVFQGSQMAAPVLGNYKGFGEEFATSPGARESFLDQIFQMLMGNAPAGSEGQKNFRQLLRGKPAIADEAIRAEKKFAKQQFRRDNANITEGMGKMGARFGTDLAATLSQGSQDFRQGLYAQEMALRTQLAENAKNRSIEAWKQLIGLGQFGAGLEFTRGEGGAQRMIEKILQELRNKGALDVAGLQAESALDIALLGEAGDL